MSHPEELLADYVDQTLGNGERAEVDRHLATCARCRSEIELAAGARAALGQLVEAEAPHGVASAALREASGRGAGVGAAKRAAPWTRWIPAAAAAALFGVLAISLPHLLGGTPSAPPKTEAFARGAQAIAPSRDALGALERSGVPLEQRRTDYSTESVRALVDQTAAQWRGARLPSSGGATSSPSTSSFGLASGPSAASALRCVFSQVPTSPHVALVRLIEASYQGQPAYVAVFLSGSGPGTPVTHVEVWIVRQHDCAIANYAERSV